MEVSANRIQQIRFGAALHHVDLCTVLRVVTGQVWRTRLCIDELGYCRALRNGCAVVKLQNRDRARWVLGQEFRRFVFTFRDIDRDEFDLIRQSLFGQSDADTGWVWEPGIFVDSHCNLQSIYQ